MLRTIISSVLLLPWVVSIAGAEIIRVPGDQPNIQAGIDAAKDGDTVLVADGVYTGKGNLNIDFTGKAITVRSENGAGACTIDCQNLGRAFIFQGGETDQSVVQGFTITNGRAPERQLGGGIVFLNGSSATITGCIITRCATGIYNGGAVFCGPGSKTIITGCIFTENSSGGGSVFYDRSEGTISHCVFTDNTCGIGGGIFCSNAKPNIFNCLIYGNKATGWPGGGGIMLNAGANPNIFNCTITDNEANDGGAVYCHKGSSPNIRDSILWGNRPDEIFIAQGGGDPVVTYSDVQGGWQGEGNIDEEPRFVVGPGGDFYLSQKSAGQPKDSKCADAGSDTAAKIGLGDRTTRTDEVGDTGLVDMGYHYATDSGQGQCKLIKRLKTRCKGKPGAFKVKTTLKSKLPQGTPLTLILDGQETRRVATNRKGKAKAKWSDVSKGDHKVCVVECPVICDDTRCGE